MVRVMVAPDFRILRDFNREDILIRWAALSAGLFTSACDGTGLRSASDLSPLMRLEAASDAGVSGPLAFIIAATFSSSETISDGTCFQSGGDLVTIACEIREHLPAAVFIEVDRHYRHFVFRREFCELGGHGFQDLRPL